MRHDCYCILLAMSFVVFGCSAETSPDSKGWQVGGDTGTSSELDALAERDGTVQRLVGTTWRRYNQDVRMGNEVIIWETFREDGKVIKHIETRSDDRRGVNLVEGEWSIQADGRVRLEYPRMEGFAFVQPRFHFRTERSALWFDVPERERRQTARWSPYSYTVDDAGSPRVFTGRTSFDFGERGRVFGVALRELRGRFAFDAFDDDNCSVQMTITARARYGEVEPCRVSRSLERSCQMESSDMPGVQKITLGYGSTPETARDNWKNVAFNTSGEDRESCQRAVEVAHTSFVPILYRFEQDDSNRDVLVSAAADRWMRHYTTDEPPEPTNESRE